MNDHLRTAIAVGETNAISAVDQLDTGVYANPIASYRTNVIDTMDELGKIDYQADALAAFDAKVAELLEERRAKIAADKIAGRLVWAILFGTDIVGVYATFDDAYAQRAELRKCWPERTFALQPTFFHQSTRPMCSECGEVAVTKVGDQCSFCDAGEGRVA